MSGDDQRVPGGSGTDAVEHLMRPTGIIKDQSPDGRLGSRGEGALQCGASLTFPAHGGSAFRMRHACLLALMLKPRRTGGKGPAGIEQGSGLFDLRVFVPGTRQSSLHGPMYRVPWIDCA